MMSEQQQSKGKRRNDKVESPKFCLFDSEGKLVDEAKTKGQSLPVSPETERKNSHRHHKKKECPLLTLKEKKPEERNERDFSENNRTRGNNLSVSEDSKRKQRRKSETPSFPSTAAREKTALLEVESSHARMGRRKSAISLFGISKQPTEQTGSIEFQKSSLLTRKRSASSLALNNRGVTANLSPVSGGK